MQLDEKDVFEKPRSKKSARKPVQPTPVVATATARPPKIAWNLTFDKIHILSILDTVFDWSFYALIFLLPLYFSPFIQDTVEFAKQQLLFAGVFWLALIALVRAIVSEKIQFKGSLMLIGFGAVLLTTLVATITSAYPYSSFFGVDRHHAMSFSTLTALVIFATLSMHTLTARHLLRGWYLLIGSFVLGTILTLLQLLGVFALPWQFAKSAAFTPFGAHDLWGVALALGIVTSVSLLLRLSLGDEKNKQLTSFALAGTVGLFLICLIILDDWRLWLMVVAGLVTTLSFLFWKLPQDKKIVWLVLPSFIIVLAGAMTIIHPPRLVSLPMSAQPTFKTSAMIAWDSLKNVPLFGYGPGAYFTAYSQHKPGEINKANIFNLWSARFEQSNSALFTAIAETGAIGILGMILLSFFVKLAIWRKLRDSVLDENFLLFATATAGLSVLALASLLKPTNMLVMFLLWFTLGAIAVFSSRTIGTLAARNQNQFLVFSSIVLSVVAIAGLVGGIINVQRITADAAYAGALSEDRRLADQASKGEVKPDDMNSLLEQLQKAAQRNQSNDTYFRTLSQGLLSKALRLANASNGAERLAEIQSHTSAALEAAKRAIEISGHDARNLENLASIYQTIAPFTGGADAFAVEFYTKAMALDPLNPALQIQLARVHLDAALPLLKKAEGEEDKEKKAAALAEGNKRLNESSTALEKAIAIKEDLPAAYYYLALIKAQEQKKEEAVALLDKAVQYNLALAQVGVQDQGLFNLAGNVYNLLGDKDKALQSLQLGLSIKFDDQQSLWNYANLLAEKGDKDTAIKVLEKLLELTPGNQEILNKLDELRGKHNAKDKEEVLSAPEQAPVEEETND